MNQWLLFDNLFEIVLADWPEEITFGKLLYHEVPNATVEGFGLQHDQLEEKWIGHKDEIIFRTLSYCIYGSLHEAAQYVLRASPKDLRREVVQKGFEAKLRRGLKRPKELYWKDRDVQLANDYFQVNHPQQVEGAKD